MNHSLFTENMKLADLILMNGRLLYVFPCFGLELGVGESTVKQVCEKKGISIPLFLLVCNVYTFDHYSPECQELEQISLAGIIDYLRRSHQDYLEVRMPQLIAEILDLVGCCHVKHGDLLTGFCEKYKEEVTTHFDYEEQVVFPYIHKLLQGLHPTDYTIEEYETNHGDIDAALSDLKNIIIKYLPDACTIEKCRGVLLDLFMFESDLSKHTLLEDKILISLVERIERKIV